MDIILKSSSPRRKELLAAMGYSFTVKVCDVDETMDIHKTPFENVKELGLKKAMAGSEEDYGKILIGCDTIVVYDNRIYGKPHSEEEAYQMLQTFSGRCHEVMSGVGIIYKEKIYNFVCTSRVYFKNLTDTDIRQYIETKECFGKAGSYAIQGIGGRLIERYEGSLNNIIGLPTEEVERVLREIYEL